MKQISRLDMTSCVESIYKRRNEKMNLEQFRKSLPSVESVERQNRIRFERERKARIEAEKAFQKRYGKKPILKRIINYLLG
jgi:hypothetical protein